MTGSVLGPVTPVATNTMLAAGVAAAAIHGRCYIRKGMKIDVGEDWWG